MEMKELTVQEMEPGATIAEQDGEEVTIAGSPINAAADPTSLHTEQLPNSLLPTLTGLWQLTLGWQPNALQEAQFQQLYTLILEGNHQFNLTRITEPTEFWEKHLWDSLVGVKAFLQVSESQRSADSGQESVVSGRELVVSGQESVIKVDATQAPLVAKPFKVIDIGTGAGFPGIPVAIAQPTWAVTLLDSTRKKMTFLEQVLATIGLTNATTLAERVEQVGRQKHYRQTYDLALVRAVAAATVCAEYALPLLKIGGCVVLYRGHWSEAETASLEGAVAVLGGKIDSIDAFTTPLTQGDRHCIYLKKIAPTPNEFPRAIGVPTQHPL